MKIKRIICLILALCISMTCTVFADDTRAEKAEEAAIAAAADMNEAPSVAEENQEPQQSVQAEEEDVPEEGQTEEKLSAEDVAEDIPSGEVIPNEALPLAEEEEDAKEPAQTEDKEPALAEDEDVFPAEEDIIEEEDASLQTEEIREEAPLLDLVKYDHAGIDITWEIKDGTLWLKGKGETYGRNLTVPDLVTPWQERASEVQRVVISEGITKINSTTFRSMGRLESVSFPASIVMIGEDAFEGCFVGKIEYAGTASQWKNVEVKDTAIAICPNIVYAKKTSIKNASVKAASCTYTGKAQEPDVAVTLGKTLVKGKDYTVTYSNNVKVGTATVVITGTGAYEGTIKSSFKITKAKLSSVKVKSATMKYTGKKKKPGVVVKAKINGKSVTLKKNRDYTVSYKNNKNIGTATVTVKGKGNYKGTIKKTFRIVPKSTKISTVKKGKNKATLKWTAVKQASGYQIQYAKNKAFTESKKVTTAKTSKTIKNLKGTYYFRIRSYKKVKGKRYYSGWSAVRSAKFSSPKESGIPSEFNGKMLTLGNTKDAVKGNKVKLIPVFKGNFKDKTVKWSAKLADYPAYLQDKVKKEIRFSVSKDGVVTIDSTFPGAGVIVEGVCELRRVTCHVHLSPVPEAKIWVSDIKEETLEKTDVDGRPVETGLYNVDGNWGYYENKLFAPKTGIAKRIDNNTYHYINNGYMSTFTGRAKSLIDGKMYYVQDGKSEHKITKLKDNCVAQAENPTGLVYDWSTVLATVTNETCPYEANLYWFSNYSFEEAKKRIKVEVKNVTPPKVRQMEKYLENTAFYENAQYIKTSAVKTKNIEKDVAGLQYAHIRDKYEKITTQSSGQINILLPKDYYISHIKVYFDGVEVLSYIKSSLTDEKGLYTNKEKNNDYKKMLKQVVDAVCTKEMTTHEKLKAVADYLQYTNYYPHNYDDELLKLQKIRDEWAIYIDGKYSLNYDLIPCYKISQMFGGFGDCTMAGGIFADIAKYILGLKEIPKDSRAEEGYYVDHLGSHEYLVYIDAKGGYHGYGTVQGMHPNQYVDARDPIPLKPLK